MVFSRKQDPKPQASNVEALPPRASGITESGLSASRTAQHGVQESVIGNDLSIEGQEITIRCQGYLRVNGDIEADLHSQNLEVGRDGHINGSIAAETVNVFGHVNGAIHGQRVILHATSVVEGDIHSANLAIESGASFDGRSRKVRNPEEISPQLTKSANRDATSSLSHNQPSVAPPPTQQAALQPPAHHPKPALHSAPATAAGGETPAAFGQRPGVIT